MDCTDEEIGRHIVRYNSGRPMVAAQKISAYMYNTAKHVKELSGHAFFNDCANYSESKDRNGSIDKVVCEAIMGINFFDAWNKNAQKIGIYLNENATENMFNKFGEYLDRLLKVVTPETGKLFSTKNAIVWFMLFDKFSKSGLSDDRFQKFLESYDELKKVKVKVEHEYEIIGGSGECTNMLSFAEIDAYKSTKDKGILYDKVHILETVMKEFLHITDEEVSSIKSVTTGEFIAELVDLPIKDVKQDMSLYEETLDDLENNTIRDGSKLLDKANRLSLLAMVAYSYKNDVDLDDWLEDYAANNNTYYMDQRKNYLHMLNSLNAFNQRIVVA